MVAVNLNDILPPIFYQVFIAVLFLAMVFGLAYDAIGGAKYRYFRMERRMVLEGAG